MAWDADEPMPFPAFRRFIVKTPEMRAALPPWLCARPGNYRIAPFLAALPAIDLDGLNVLGEPLPAAIGDELAAALRAGLSDAGWRMADERALSRLVAGPDARARRSGPSPRTGCAGGVGVGRGSGRDQR
jgi:hypothetical protein